MLQGAALAGWGEALAKSLTEPNIFLQMLDAEENLKGVPKELLEPPQEEGVTVSEFKLIATTAPTGDIAARLGFAPEPTLGPDDFQGVLVLDRANGRTNRMETLRHQQIMMLPAHATQIWWYDPQADEPLHDVIEAEIQQLGPPVYLNWLIKEYNLTIQPMPTMPHDCHRAIRKSVRTLREYQGERFIQ